MRIVFLLFTLFLSLPSTAQRCVGDQTPNPTLAQSLRALGHASEQVNRAQTPAKAAAAWFRLNQSADRFARDLTAVSGRDRYGHTKCTDVAHDAGAYGIQIFWCEWDAGWAAQRYGYLIYSQFLPNGPEAEAAWWYGRLHHSSECGDDLAGTPEEARFYAKQYEVFLKRFPHGRYAAAARKMLALFRKDSKPRPVQ